MAGARGASGELSIPAGSARRSRQAWVLPAALILPIPSQAGRHVRRRHPIAEESVELETLRDLYIDELKDLWSAEKQLV